MESSTIVNHYRQLWQFRRQQTVPLANVMQVVCPSPHIALLFDSMLVCSEGGVEGTAEHLDMNLEDTVNRPRSISS